MLAFALTFGVELVWQQLAPMPAGTNPSDPAAVAAFLRTAPVSAFIAVLVGWTIAAFAGSYVASLIARRGQWPGWVVTGLYLLATAANFAMIPHPAWFMAVAVLLIVGAGWLGSAGRPPDLASRLTAACRPAPPSIGGPHV